MTLKLGIWPTLHLSKSLVASTFVDREDQVDRYLAILKGVDKFPSRTYSCRPDAVLH